MKNIITKGTETLQNYHYPLAEDNCVIGKIQDVSSSLIRFTKIFDAGDTKSYYAVPRYNGRTAAVQAEHLPVAGNFARFYRVGNFNSQGTNGFELRNEDASKSSFLWLADYLEKETEPSPLIPRFIDKYFSVASWYESSLTNRSIPAVSKIYYNNTYYKGNNIFFLSRQGSAFKLMSTWDGEYTKDFRFASSQNATVEYYTNYDGNGVFSGLLFSHNRCVLYNQYSSSPTVFIESPRHLTLNKTDMATPIWHPYDVAPSVYIKINEYQNPAVLASGGVSNYIERTRLENGQTVKYRDDISFWLEAKNGATKVGNLSNEIHFHYSDSYIFSNPTRTEKTPVKIVAGAIWVNHNSPALIADTTTINVPLINRFSGHYGTSLPAWKQWILQFSSVLVQATQVNLNATSIDTSSNDNAVAVLAGNAGSGGLVPGTTIIANYYYNAALTSPVTESTTPGYSGVSRLATNWKKWNGVSWGSATIGDTITSLQVEDTWLTKTRQSNIVATSFTLI